MVTMGAGAHAGGVFAMTWEATGIAQAWAVFGDVDEAAETVCASVGRAAAYGAPGRGPAYRDAAERVAAHMREDGRAAVSAGRPWKDGYGPVRVSLAPWEAKHGKAPHRPGKGR
jgi:hypothetical protein